MRPHDVDDFRAAWATIERLWESTAARARTFPETALHRSVDDEWSFIQTLRHLNFATAAWVSGLILRDPAPAGPALGRGARVRRGSPRPRRAAPLDEVLAVRRERQAMVGEVMATLTGSAPGWPLVESCSLAEALRVVLNEEWEHRLYAERDLTSLENGN